MKDVVSISNNFIVIKKPIFVFYNKEQVIDFFNNLIPYLKNGYKCFYIENGEPITNQYIINLKVLSNLFKHNDIKQNQFVVLYENDTKSHINYLNNLGFESILYIKHITDLELVKSFVENSYLSDKLDKNFLFLNKAQKPHREELYNYFKNENIINNTYYSAKWINDSNFEEDYESEKIRVRVDQHNHLLGIYNQSYIHIVTETKCEDVIENIEVSFFSEKTIRHLAFNRPFILVSQKNSLKTLKSYGFKTFDEFIDESYDGLNYDERMYKIKNIINNLNKKTNKELFEICKNCENIFEHNRLHLLEFESSIKNNINKKYPYLFKEFFK